MPMTTSGIGKPKKSTVSTGSLRWDDWRRSIANANRRTVGILIARTSGHPPRFTRQAPAATAVPTMPSACLFRGAVNKRNLFVCQALVACAVSVADRPGRDVQYPREQSFASLNGRKSVKDLEALAYERHRTVSHPTNSAALICEEAPVLRPPMR